MTVVLVLVGKEKSRKYEIVYNQRALDFGPNNLWCLREGEVQIVWRGFGYTCRLDIVRRMFKLLSNKSSNFVILQLTRLATYTNFHSQ